MDLYFSQPFSIYEHTCFVQIAREYFKWKRKWDYGSRQMEHMHFLLLLSKIYLWDEMYFKIMLFTVVEQTWGLKATNIFLVSHSLVGIREHFTWEFPAEGLSRGCNQDVGWAGGWAAAIWRRYGPGVCCRAPSRGCWQEASASYHGASAQRWLSDLLTWHLASLGSSDPRDGGQGGSQRVFPDLASEVQLLLVTQTNFFLKWA